MLLRHFLFLLCAAVAIATPWGGHHYWRQHQHSAVGLSSSSSANPAGLPAAAAVLLQERAVIMPRQSPPPSGAPAGDEEDYQDECSDEDEEDVTNGQQGGTQAAGANGANATASQSPDSSSSSPATSPTQHNGAPVGGQQGKYVLPGSGGSSGLYQQPYSNASFPAAQVQQGQHPAAAQSPPPGVGQIGSQANPQSNIQGGNNNVVTNPTSGEGQAQQDIQPVASPQPQPQAASSSAPAKTAPTSAASGNVDLAVGVYKASFTKWVLLSAPLFHSPPIISAISLREKKTPSLTKFQLRLFRQFWFRKLQYTHLGLWLVQQPRLQRRSLSGALWRWARRWSWPCVWKLLQVDA